MTETQIKELLNLPKDEKIDLVQTLWDSIAEEQSNSEISDEHKKILDDRLEKINDGSMKFKSWDEIKNK